MKPKLYVHIGHSKVASTSIQAYMDRNIDVMREQGFLVAHIDGSFPEQGPVTANPVGLLQQARDGGPKTQAVVKQRFRDLHESMTKKKSRFDKAVISAENLCNPRFEPMFEGLRELFDMQLVYYIRRQDEWLISAWKQWGIKGGKSLGEFCMHGVHTRYPAFLASIERWEPYVHDMHVRALHPSVLYGNKVTTDFAYAIGLDPTNCKEAGVSNPSFDVSVLEVLRHNPYLFEHADDDRMFDFLTEFLPSDIKSMRAVLDWETRTKLVRYFEPENRELLRRFFPEGDYRRIFGLQEIDGSLRQLPPQELMLRFMGLQLRAMKDMHEEMQQLRDRIKRLGG